MSGNLLSILCLCAGLSFVVAGSPSCNPTREAELLSIRDQFNREGYTVLKDFFAENPDDGDESLSLVPLLRDDWYGFSTKYWDRIFEVLHQRGHISQPKHVMNEEYVRGKLRQPGFKEIVHRYPGRYELSLVRNTVRNDDSDSDSGVSLLYHDMPALQPIIDKLEPVILSILKQHPNYKEEEEGSNGTRKYNLLQSMLISAPGSESQKFHIDTKHLNDQEEDEDVHLPAHIINVFIPLIDIKSNDLGPTELVPESHVQTRYMYNPKTRSKAKQLAPPVTPLMNVGDVLLFDFRILHRGLANTDLRNINRPLLVLAFSLPSFHDTANWPGPSIFE